MVWFRSPYRMFMSGFLVLLVMLVLSFPIIEKHYIYQLARENDNTSRLVVSALEGALKRFEPLPALLAQKKDIKWLLTYNDAESHISRLNEELKIIAQNFGASDIYVLNNEGRTLAASNYDSGVSFIGQNFSYRPYFYEALAGKNTRFFALGTTSLKRGYFFSAPVTSGDKILGVIAVKIRIDFLEKDWSGAKEDIFVADKNGVLFMASNRNWLFKTLKPLNDESLKEISLSRQYPLEKLTPLETYQTTKYDGLTFSHIKQESNENNYLESRWSIQNADLNVHVLSPRQSAINQSIIATSVAFLVGLLVLLVLSIVLQRRARLIMDIAHQQQLKKELELRVEERTQALHESNQLLVEEVKERTQAEKQLRSMQAELIQAGKLAALGQMSASLSHELNQPLSAVKSYADNARAFLQREKYDKADTNIGRISEMVDRMAELGKHLRNFARKPQQTMEAVYLRDVFASVEQIMKARLKDKDVILKIAPFDEELCIKGGLVRLQQVFVNLVNNAIDATQENGNRQIEISLKEEKDDVSISVRDFGKGIDERALDSIFDPFFTTKGVNEGLGLGLSISYNIIRDFGGYLKAENHPKGGAIFTLHLKTINAFNKAAE